MATTKPSAKVKPQPATAPELLLQIEYYRDSDAEHPDAAKRFLKRLSNVSKEQELWGTVVLDSTTSAELAARMLEKYVNNPTAKDGRQWYAGSTDYLERAIQINLGSLNINALVLSHVDNDKDEVHGMFLRQASVRGRLKNGVGSTFNEVYHSYVTKDEKGERAYGLQTHSDNLYFATTQLDLPDPVYPDYTELFRNNPEDEGSYPIHANVFGEYGTGKSTFAATFARAGKPLLVFFFDGIGKERPYLKRGVVVECDPVDGTPVKQVWTADPR